MKVERTIKNTKKGNSEYRTVKVKFEGKTFKLNQYGEPGEPLRSNWRMSKTQFKNLLKAYPTLFFIKSEKDKNQDVAWKHATSKMLKLVLEDINDYDMKIDYNMEGNIIEVWSLAVGGWLLGFEGNTYPDTMNDLE
jgi:hypothetical protein